MVFYYGRYFLGILTALILISSPLNLHSVMISSVRIAYVDVGKVFEQLQKVEDFRSELRQIVKEKKEEIEELERAIASVRHKVLNQKDELPAFEVEEFESLLTKKEKELRQLMEESKLLIKGKEKEYKYKILGEIYEVINSVASRDGYTVVLEKNLVLFSEETVYDITDEVINKINTADE